MPLSYGAVIFDLDGTLISEETGVEEATASVADALRARGYDVSGPALNAARTAVVREAMAANRGTWPHWLTREEWMRRAFALVDAPSTLAGELGAVYLQGRIDGLALLDDAIDLLEAVQAQAPTGLITNGDGREQRMKLERVGLDRYFPEPVISAEFGAEKPAAAIFVHAVESLGVQASESVYVGNSYGNDVEGAAGAGLDAVWLNARGAPGPADSALLPTHTTPDLRGVREFLGV